VSRGDGGAGVSDALPLTEAMVRRSFLGETRRSTSSVRSRDRPPGVGAVVGDSLARLDSFAARVAPYRVPMEPGKYYELCGYGEPETKYFSDGLVGIVNSAGTSGYEGFFRGLNPSIKAEAFACAMREYNQATVRHNAAVSLVARVGDRRDDFGVVHGEAFQQWVAMIRDVIISASATSANAIEVLRCASSGSVRALGAAGYQEDEIGLVEFLFKLLNTCVGTGDVKGIGDVGSNYSDVYYAAEKYPQLAARWHVKLTGGSVRHRVANFVLGDKPVVVDAVRAIES